jgi:hypothetical protein
MALKRHHRPDPSTAERLVAGRVGADDAPPGYRRVATLLGDAGSGFPEPAGPAEAGTISAMVAAIQAEPAPQVASRRSGMLRKVLAAKTVAIVSVVALSASGAAAATGHLPDAVQDKVAKAAKHVGVNLPDGVERVAGAPDCEVNGETIVARNRGQFLKQAREQAKGDAVAFEAAKKLKCGMPLHSDGAPGADEADETSGNPGKSGKSKEQGKAGDDHGKAGEDLGTPNEDHGAPADTPAAVETPNPGGIDTGGAASEGANDTGAEHAEDGSANSDLHPTPEDHPSADDLPTPDVPGAGS